MLRPIFGNNILSGIRSDPIDKVSNARIDCWPATACGTSPRHDTNQYIVNSQGATRIALLTNNKCLVGFHTITKNDYFYSITLHADSPVFEGLKAQTMLVLTCDPQLL